MSYLLMKDIDPNDPTLAEIAEDLQERLELDGSAWEGPSPTEAAKHTNEVIKQWQKQNRGNYITVRKIKDKKSYAGWRIEHNQVLIGYIRLYKSKKGIRFDCQLYEGTRFDQDTGKSITKEPIFYGHREFPNDPPWPPRDFLSFYDLDQDRKFLDTEEKLLRKKKLELFFEVAKFTKETLDKDFESGAYMREPDSTS